MFQQETDNWKIERRKKVELRETEVLTLAALFDKSLRAISSPLDDFDLICSTLR